MCDGSHRTRSAATDRGDHVESRSGRERRGELGALAVHEDADVPAQSRAVAHAITQTRPTHVELGDRVLHARGVHIQPARQAREQRRKRRREMDVGHSGSQSSTATSTDVIPGR